MRRLDEQYLKAPWCGSRQVVRCLRRQCFCVSRKRVRRLMRKTRLVAIAPQPGTSCRHPQHAVYPYLLRESTIDRLNQVWSADVIYIPLARGFVYPVAIMGWYSRKVLAWRVSNTLDAQFSVAALAKALAKHGSPESSIPITVLSSPAPNASTCSKPAISASRWTATPSDGQCFHRTTLALTRIRLRPRRCFRESARRCSKMKVWIDYYNNERPHSIVEDLTPSKVFENVWPIPLAA